jgi:UDPglucose 6-dehydrogenase
MSATAITVIGSGYVGLVTGVCLAHVGHDVTCVDVRGEVVDRINHGEPPFFEPGLEALLREVVAAGRFRASLDLPGAVRRATVVFLAVGTPSTDAGIDLTDVTTAAEHVGLACRPADRYRVVVVKSTVVPGTTDSVVGPAVMRAGGLSAGEFGLCMNPEFLREGSAVSDFLQPDRVVIGAGDPRAADVLAGVYAPFGCPILRTGLRDAELIKYASNALLATLISFSNEIAGLCEHTPETDVHVVMDGLHLDRRLSPVVDGRRVRPDVLSYLRAGSGFGGSCFPKDVTALRQYGRTLGVPTPMLDAVLSINAKRPADVIALADAITGGVRGRVVAMLGLTFKADTDDLRESPALALARALIDGGADVRAYDPLYTNAATVPGVSLALMPSLREVVTGADLAVLGTGWPEFREANWTELAGLMRTPVLLDARNYLRDTELPAVLQYHPIGRSALRRS